MCVESELSPADLLPSGGKGGNFEVKPDLPLAEPKHEMDYETGVGSTSRVHLASR
jgi:hypothetical protein